MTERDRKLALFGGDKAVRDELPHFLNAAGRTFGAEEERLLLEALRSGCLSRNGGTFVHRLESEFAARLGTRHAVACSSGSAAVHLAVAALDPEPGDEFIVPPITDLGTMLPVIWNNCLPVFADVDRRTLTLDPDDVRRKIGPRTRAIIAVHLAGQPCDLDALAAIAREHGIVLIEDCAQAYWAEHRGRRVGTIGDIACFSLQQSKHITCGEGGIMATDNEEYARRAVLFADKAWPRESSALGSSRFLFLAQNYRLSELQGAVAVAQLPKIESVVERRRQAAEKLTARISRARGVSGPYTLPGTRPAYWLYMLHVDAKRAGVDAEHFGNALVAEGVPAWVRYLVDPLYCSPIFAEQKTYGTSGFPFREWGRQKFAKGLCPNAEKALSGVIAIHWNENYNDMHIEQIAAAILKVARHFAGEPAAA
ncbi:MAG: DegT/DnrJ/EryC1/StrS family aminotransferase [Bryobacterales bacterium]|nr:DegT/DnrJ/EryC1/StrS family aminotransferase [Bryobacterales bacterium]